MTTLLHHIGEQPMPILLPDRFLRPARWLLVCTARAQPAAQLQCPLPQIKPRT
jgi:hypothetical protein